MSRPFRFGVQSFNAESGADWRDKARRAEDLGYSALHLADHILGPGPALEKTNHPVQNIAAVPAMAFAAAATDTLKIGCRVFCVDYRLPVVLVKEAMTLDLLSDGRLELGLGAGWLEEEYHALGIEFDTPGRRIERLHNVVLAIKAYAHDGRVDVANDDVRWRDFEGLPKSIQKPHPPIMIGGGAPKILGLAGREADIASLNFNNRAGIIGPEGVRLSTAEETAKKIGWIRDGAQGRFDDVEIEIGAYFTFVVDDAASIVGNFASSFGLSEDEIRAHPHGLFGGVETIKEELARRRESYGISYVTVGENAMEAFAPIVADLTGH